MPDTISILKILFRFPLSAGHGDLIFSIFCTHFWALSVENCCIEFADHIFRDHTNIFCLKSGFLVCPFPIPITISPLTDFGLKFPGSHHPDLLPFYQFTLQVLQRISKSFLLKNSWKIQKLSILWCTVELCSAKQRNDLQEFQ